MHHEPNFEQRLLHFIEGHDDPELARHIDACPDCQDELQTVRLLVTTRETTGATLPELPDSLTASLASLLPRVRPDLVPRARPSMADRVKDRVSAIIADLVLDSGATPQLAGLRGTTDRARQLAFVSDLADLDLELTPVDGQWLVTGQLGMDNVPAGLEIRFVPATQDPLVDDPHDRFRAPISPDGYFDLTITDGEWIAAVTMDDATIIFQDISV